MKIIFAPTKLFNEKAKTTNQSTMFENLTNHIVDQMKNKSKEALKQKYKVSDQLLDTVYDYYHNFDENNKYVAFDFFMGESFKYFDYSSLTEQNLRFLNDNVYVLDALYGIIKPDSGIKPYRMDFTQNEMRKVWKAEINTYFENQKYETILSLASKEFSQLVDKHKFKLYEVSFIDCKDEVCKKVSVFNKQMRGQLLRYIVECSISSVEQLPNSISGYIKEVQGFEILYKRKN